MRFLALAALTLTPTSVLAVTDCRVTGTPSAFGVDMTAFIAVKSGATCNFPMRIPGMMNASGISQNPAHGTLRRINLTTFTYSVARGYSGSDSFAIYGIGKGPYGSGRSVMTVNATIQ